MPRYAKFVPLLLVGTASLSAAASAQSGLYFSEDGNAKGLYRIDTATGAATALGVTGVTGKTVGLAPSALATELHASSPADLHRVATDGSGFGLVGAADAEALAYHRGTDTLFACKDGDFFAIDTAVGGVAQDLPDLGLDVEGLAYDLRRGVVWGLVGQGSNDTVLFCYTPETATWHKVLDTGIDWDTPGLAHDPVADLLYVKDTVTSALIAIDPNSGKVFKVGDTKLNTGGGLAYVPAPVSLECTAHELFAGDSVAISSFDGLPGGLVLLFAVEFNGTPIFLRTASGKFDAKGRYDLKGTVPAGVSGVDLDFLAIGFSAPGVLAVSNPIELHFQ